MSEERARPPATAGGIRASDQDREQLIAELSDHSAAGRLTPEELDERVEDAYSARTLAELDALRHDLPATPAEVARAAAERRRHLRRRMMQETGSTLGAFLICTGVWFASGRSGQFWPVWVLLAFVILLVRDGWALYGPGADLDAVEARLNARRAHERHRRQRRSARRGPPR